MPSPTAQTSRAATTVTPFSSLALAPAFGLGTMVHPAASATPVIRSSGIPTAIMQDQRKLIGERFILLLACLGLPYESRSVLHLRRPACTSPHLLRLSKVGRAKQRTKGL